MGREQKIEEQVTFDDLGDLLAPRGQSDESALSKTAVFSAIDAPDDAPEEELADPEQPPADAADPGEPGIEDAADDAHDADESPREASGGHTGRAKDQRARLAALILLGLGLVTAAFSVVPARFLPVSFDVSGSILTVALLLMVAGLACGQIAVLLRTRDQAHARMEELSALLLKTQRTGRSTRRKVRALLGHAQQQTDRPSASGEELNRVLQFMQKQDEKLVNLNLATKMYGKAIVDLSTKLAALGKSTDRNHELGDKQAGDLLPSIEKLLAAAGEKVAARVEERVGSAAAKKDTLSRSETQALLDRNGAALLQKTATQFEQQLAGVKEMLRESREDLAARIKSLVPQPAPTGGPELEQLVQKCESIQKALSSLDRKLSSAASAAALPLRETQAPAAEAARRQAQAGDVGQVPDVRQAQPAGETGQARAPQPVPANTAKSDVHGAIAKLKKLRGP